MNQFAKKAIKLDLNKEGVLKIVIKKNGGFWGNTDKVFMIYKYKERIYASCSEFEKRYEEIVTSELIDTLKKDLNEDKKEISDIEAAYNRGELMKVVQSQNIIGFIERQLGNISEMNKRGFYAENFRRKNLSKIMKSLEEGELPFEIYTKYRKEFGLSDKVILAKHEVVENV